MSPSLPRGIIQSIESRATWRLSAFYVKQIKKYYEVSTIFEYVKKLSMIIGCNI